MTGSKLRSSKAKVPFCPRGWRNLSHIHTPTVRNVDQSEGPKCWTHSPHFPNRFLSKVTSGGRTWARLTIQTISIPLTFIASCPRLSCFSLEENVRIICSKNCSKLQLLCVCFVPIFFFFVLVKVTAPGCGHTCWGKQACENRGQGRADRT